MAASCITRDIRQDASFRERTGWGARIRSLIVRSKVWLFPLEGPALWNRNGTANSAGKVCRSRPPSKTQNSEAAEGVERCFHHRREPEPKSSRWFSRALRRLSPWGLPRHTGSGRLSTQDARGVQGQPQGRGNPAKQPRPPRVSRFSGARFAQGGGVRPLG